MGILISASETIPHRSRDRPVCKPLLYSFLSQTLTARMLGCDIAISIKMGCQSRNAAFSVQLAAVLFINFVVGRVPPKSTLANFGVYGTY